jgi:predicted metal-binding membrane protein
VAVIEAVAKRDRLVVLSGLLLAAALAWFYLIDMAVDMGDMSGGGGNSLSGEMSRDADGGVGMTGDAPGAMSATDTVMQMQAWSVSDGLLMFAMWAIMMVAMMLPSAAPMILIFAKVNRKQRENGNPYVPTSLFALGYILMWAAFSIAATAIQWGLQSAALLSPMMVSTSVILGGVLFIAAGIYQWTPLKYACLKNCRSPLSFIMQHWQPGQAGAFRMGLGHGSFCLGCCWFVMGLLFVGGVMNLAWVAAITVFVVAEKIFPHGQWVARAGGVAMVGAGVYLFVAGYAARSLLRHKNEVAALVPGQPHIGILRRLVRVEHDPLTHRIE